MVARAYRDKGNLGLVRATVKVSTTVLTCTMVSCRSAMVGFGRDSFISYVMRLSNTIPNL